MTDKLAKCTLLFLIAGTLNSSFSDVVIAQNDQSVSDSSHVLIMAIKSVSGEIPENEFFAATWRIKYFEPFYTLANVDIALANVNSDSVESDTRELSEAGISILADVSQIMGTNRRHMLERSIFAGLTTKIFNTEAYYGPSVGSIELKNSAFYSTYFILAYLRRFFPTNNQNRVVDGIKHADDNLFAEFLIHSQEVEFFKYLAVKGGVLIPLLGSRGEFSDIQFRITVAVPVGRVFTF